MFWGRDIDRNNQCVYSDPGLVESYSEWQSLSKTEETIMGLFIQGKLSVLDLGCGTGRVAAFLRGQVDEYLGVDSSKLMINVAKKKHPEMDFLVSDAEVVDSLPLQYDCVLFMHNGIDLVYPFRKRIRVIEGIKNRLKKGGLFIYSSHIRKWENIECLLPLEFSKTLQKTRFNLFRTGCYFPELYRGKLIWGFRTSVQSECLRMQKLGFAIKAALLDESKIKPDWVYYVFELE